MFFFLFSLTNWLDGLGFAFHHLEGSQQRKRDQFCLQWLYCFSFLIQSITYLHIDMLINKSHQGEQNTQYVEIVSHWHQSNGPRAGLVVIRAGCLLCRLHIQASLWRDGVIISGVTHINWVSSCKKLDLRCSLATPTRAYRKYVNPNFFSFSMGIS